jgi:two-component system sensor histidine kinase RstB
VCVGGDFAYVLIETINGQRAQNYREDMASGAFYLITQGIARQPDAISRQNWIDDASLLLNLPLALISQDQIELDRHEQDLIDQQQTVVRYNTDKLYADVYAKVPNQSLLLYARVDKMSEQQIKAIRFFCSTTWYIIPTKSTSV